MNKQYPVFFLELENGNLKYGIDDIALVDKPAIESMFMAFSQEEPIKFSVNSEEQRIITGPVMIPDKMIYRISNGKEFYVAATKDTIFQAAQQWGKENRNNNMKLTHDAISNTPDVFMFESFVTNESRVASVKGYEDLPIGSWFITCKVISDQVWSQVKDGTFKGFSLEALFKLEPVAVLNDEEIAALMSLID